MLEHFRKIAKKKLVSKLIMTLIILAVFLGASGYFLYIHLYGYTDLSTVTNLDDYKNELVQYDVNVMLCPYAEKTQYTEYSNGVKGSETTTATGYIVYDQKNNAYFGYLVSATEYSYYDDFCIDSINSITKNTALPQPFHVSGKLRIMDNKQIEYYKDAFSDFYYPIETIEESGGKVYFYYIDETNKYINPKNFAILFASIAGIVLLGMLVTIIQYVRKKYSRKILKYIEREHINIADMDRDFFSAEQISKNCWVGYYWTFCFECGSLKAIYNPDLIWAYYYRRTGRYVESKMIVYDTKGCQDSINLSKKDTYKVLDIYEKSHPYILLGYSDEIYRKVRRNLNEFLNSHYYPVKQSMDEQNQQPYDQWDYSNTNYN